MDTKETQLMKMIDQTSHDETVKKDALLYRGLIQAYQALDSYQDIKKVSYKLDSTISEYLMMHQYQAPKSVIELAQFIQKDSNSVLRGIGMTTLR